MGRRQQVRQQIPICSSKSGRQHHHQRDLSTTATATVCCASLFVFAFVLSHHCVLAEYAQNVAPQVPNVIDALHNFGNAPLATDYMYLMKNAVPGVTFPTHGYIPYTSFGCEQVPHPGYFADVETDCQVFRRCDHRGDMTSYLCPNGTLYNQLTLVCDWWFNVDCARAREFYSYANPRINNRYVQLHDNKLDGYGGGGGGGPPGPPISPPIGIGGGGYGAGPIIPAIPVVPIGPPISVGYGIPKPPGGGYGPPPPPPPLPYDAYGSSVSVAVGSPSGGTAAYGQAPAASSSQGSYGSPANRVQYRRSTQKAAQEKQQAAQQQTSSAASELTPKAVLSVTGGGSGSSTGGADHVANASEQSNVISGSTGGAAVKAAEMIAASRAAHHHQQQQPKA